MHMFWSSLAELRLSASVEASMRYINWELMEKEYEREVWLDTFDYVGTEVTGLEDRYTLLLATAPTSAAAVDEMIHVADEIVACYVFLDLRDRYEAIEALLVC